MVCAPYCSADGSALLILPLVNGFPNGSRAVLLRGRQHIAHSSARRWLSRWFARCIVQRMAAYCSYLRSSMAFTSVCVPCCLADGSGLLILPPVNGFQDGLRTVWLSGWHRIAYTSARQWLSQQFARRIAQQMVADYSNLCSSMAFPTVRAPYHLADSSLLLILPHINAFYGLRAVFLSGWYRIASPSSRQCLSPFTRRFAQRMATDCSFFRSLTPFIPVEID